MATNDSWPKPQFDRERSKTGWFPRALLALGVFAAIPFSMAAVGPEHVQVSWRSGGGGGGAFSADEYNYIAESDDAMYQAAAAMADSQFRSPPRFDSAWVETDAASARTKWGVVTGSCLLLAPLSVRVLRSSAWRRVLDNPFVEQLGTVGRPSPFKSRFRVVGTKRNDEKPALITVYETSQEAALRVAAERGLIASMVQQGPGLFGGPIRALSENRRLELAAVPVSPSTTPA